MKKGRQDINPVKEQLVNDTVKLISSYPIIGLINLTGLPAAALQEIKLKLHSQAEVKVVRKRLLRFALEKSKPDLVSHIPDQPALLVTKENPFKIYKFIVQNKSNRAAKAGDIAESEIIVSAGPTDLMPGPAMTTLNAVKIRSKVEGGKIAILNDVSVAQAGDTINEKLAPVLSMLKMKPIKVGLDVRVILEDGTIYSQDVLYIDEAQTLANLFTASQHAFNLAVESGYPTPDTIEFIIKKGFNEARAICLEANILEKDFIDEVLAKAVREANLLKSLVPETVPDKKSNDTDTNQDKEETKTEDPKKEKKEQEKKEKKNDKKEKKETSTDEKGDDKSNDTDTTQEPTETKLEKKEEN